MTPYQTYRPPGSQSVQKTTGPQHYYSSHTPNSTSSSTPYSSSVFTPLDTRQRHFSGQSLHLNTIYSNPNPISSSPSQPHYSRSSFAPHHSTPSKQTFSYPTPFTKSTSYPHYPLQRHAHMASPSPSLSGENASSYDLIKYHSSSRRMDVDVQKTPSPSTTSTTLSHHSTLRTPLSDPICTPLTRPSDSGGHKRKIDDLYTLNHSVSPQTYTVVVDGCRYVLADFCAPHSGPLPEAYLRGDPVPEELRDEKDTSSTKPSWNPNDYLPKVQSRIKFSAWQLSILWAVWHETKDPSMVWRQRLGRWFGLRTKNINIWFQNQRATAKAAEKEQVVADNENDVAGDADADAKKKRPLAKTVKPVQAPPPPSAEKLKAVLYVVDGTVTPQAFFEAYPATSGETPTSSSVFMVQNAPQRRLLPAASLEFAASQKMKTGRQVRRKMSIATDSTDVFADDRSAVSSGDVSETSEGSEEESEDDLAARLFGANEAASVLLSIKTGTA